ncbi:serine/threonine-protein kinase [Streptomyces sp. NPDC052107]|uniref:serine/threonine-protein kinase n=1 Tax=Streptomyces sp. NPDC052107 TaxID=3155632 RepID=UPI0034416AA9
MDPGAASRPWRSAPRWPKPDLKPSNVLLAVDGPRVIDFGISVATGSSLLTEAGMTIGTPGFMSPEQVSGRAVGPASDVFSLGAVLAYTATGVAPFGTGTSHVLNYRTLHGQPDLRRLPPALHQVVAACLAKQPQQRPTVSTLLHQLAQAGRRGEQPEAVTLQLTGLDWMPHEVALLVRRHSSAPLPQMSPPGTSFTDGTPPAFQPRTSAHERCGPSYRPRSDGAAQHINPGRDAD